MSEEHEISRTDRESYRTWTGPRAEDWDPGQVCLRAPVPGSRWPYGPPCAHQGVCVLHTGGLYCDCAASDASDTAWGMPP